MSRADLHDRLSYALAWIRGKTDTRPEAGVILGSGLGALAERLEETTVVPYREIPEFPVPRVMGHPGRLVLGRIAGGERRASVAVMQGRVHRYEGWTPEEVAFGTRVLCMLGIRLLVVTNASGAVNPDIKPGDLVRIEDHINLSGANPLAGVNDDRLGPRFPDMTRAYDPTLSARLDETAKRLGITLRKGVYACMAGPSYETPAEIRMLRVLGADMVGMSTVPEVIAARHMGVPVVGVSVVTNLAAGLAGKPLSHHEVAEVAAREGDRLAGLLAEFLPGALP